MLAPVLRALRSRGFKPVASKGLTRAFDGDLKTKYGDVPIRFEIRDWDFLTYPRIVLRQRPPFLPDPLSHVTESGDFCYLRRGSIVLDRFVPGGAVLQCLNAAQEVLEDLVARPERGAKDLEDEFLAYWEAGQDEPFRVVLGDIEPGATYASFFELDVPRLERKLAMVASDAAEPSRLAKSLGAPEPEAFSCRCWILRSNVYPVAPAATLPRTVKALFEYLSRWDRAVYNGVQKVLEYRKEYLAFKFVTFAVDTPAGWLGFSFELDDTYRRGYARNPRRYKQYLHRKGGTRRITRLWIAQVGPSFIHERNLSHNNLTKKKVVLIGCGAIGGFVAQGLVRLGAGTGKGGTLRLIDSGWLGPENLGRHWLGMEGLFLPKAQAVAERLLKDFGHAKIQWELADAASVLKTLFDADLVIDATGEEPVNEMVNEAHLLRKAPRPPVLYAWVKGNGDCAQVQWVDGTGGCYRCRRLPPGPNYRAERFPVLKREPQMRFVGCHSFVPYAVSAPMQASALALEMIGDWLKGNPSPRFRTRAGARADTRSIRDQDIEALTGCPACSSR